MRRLLACLLFVTLFFNMTGCRRLNSKEPVKREIFSMDTRISITCYGKEAEAAVDAAAAEIERLNQLWSIGIESSEVSQINQSGGGALSEETEEILDLALRLHDETDGALDITVLPLMELWGFTGSDPAVPAQEDIAAALENVGADRLQITNHTLTLDESQGIDFGAIAKGYASNRAAELMASYDIDGAVLSLGGNIQCMGKKPVQGGAQEWRIGIRRPDDGEGYLGILTLTDKAVVTSGGYERYFEENGQKYHHILDPKTGYPADSGLVSVTIVSADGALADGLSTACFVMGLDQSIAYWKAHAEAFDMVLMTEDGTLYVTEPLQNIFESEMDAEIINQ